MTYYRRIGGVCTPPTFCGLPNQSGGIRLRSSGAVMRLKCERRRSSQATAALARSPVAEVARALNGNHCTRFLLNTSPILNSSSVIGCASGVRNVFPDWGRGSKNQSDDAAHIGIAHGLSRGKHEVASADVGTPRLFARCVRWRAFCVRGRGVAMEKEATEGSKGKGRLQWWLF